MDRNTKTKVVAGAVGALVLAMAVGAAGAIAASRALSDDDERHAVDDRGGFDRRPSFDRPPFRYFRPFAHPGAFGGLDAAATYLDLTEEELHERLRDGETLAEIAEDEGKPVAGLVDAMVAAAEEKIDDAVEDGRLTEERADELKQELEERITDLVNGERRGPFGFGFHGFLPGGIEPRDFRERGPRA